MMTTIKNNIVSDVEKELKSNNDSSAFPHILNARVMKWNMPNHIMNQVVKHVLVLKNEGETMPESEEDIEENQIEGDDTDTEESEEELTDPKKNKNCTTSSSTTILMKRKNSISRLNENDERLLQLPAKKKKRIIPSSEESSDNDNERDGGDEANEEVFEETITDSSTKKRPKRASGKTPRRNHPPGALIREAVQSVVEDKMSRKDSKLRRKSKINEPQRFDPSSDTTQKISNQSTTTSNNSGKKKTHFRQFSNELREMPKNVGRSKNLFPFRFVDVNRNFCSACNCKFNTGTKFCSTHDYARLCGTCGDKSPCPVKDTEISEYVNAREASNLKRCLVCATLLGNSNHGFGEYRICLRCVIDKKCPCLTCGNLKAPHKRRLGELLKCQAVNTMQYDFIGDEFSNREQILLFLRRKELSVPVNQILSNFTSDNSVRESSYGAIMINHLEMTIQKLSEFGSMKSYDTRKKNSETKYKWFPNKGKKRIFRDHTMSYAEELLKNDTTLSIPHSDDLNVLVAHIMDAVERSKNLKDGVFSFRFIQFFFDRTNGTKGNDWTSYVLDQESNHLFYFDRNSHFAKQIAVLMNSTLEAEYNSFHNGNTTTEPFTKIELQKVDEFQLAVYAEDEKFRYDTGLASIIHSWTRSTPDIFGSETSFDVNSHTCLNTFDLMDERTVERFRQLVLFWFISNNMNMHLFIDLREKVELEME